MKFVRASKSITLTKVPPVSGVDEFNSNCNERPHRQVTAGADDQSATSSSSSSSSSSDDCISSSSASKSTKAYCFDSSVQHHTHTHTHTHTHNHQHPNHHHKCHSYHQHHHQQALQLSKEQYQQYYLRPKQYENILYPIGSEGVAHLGGGKLGRFHQLRNDFSIFYDDCSSDEEDQTTAAVGRGRFKNEPDWSKADGEKVKRVRFGICLLALLGLALCVMSRLVLNVAIVEMVKQLPLVVEGEVVTDEDSTLISVDEFGTTPNINDTDLLAQTTTKEPAIINMTTANNYDNNNNSDINSDSSSAALNDTVEDTSEQDDIDAGLKFEWSKTERNMILGAFYVGLVPGIFFGGPIANRYGSKSPLLAALFGTALINLMTPTIARTGVVLMIASRVAIGLIQGCLYPCLYDLFSKWLTATESSIFAPLIKVSFPMGSLIGVLMPGILSTFGFKWPTLFYLGGSACLIWSMLWLYFATSRPQDNKFVEPNELKRIMRKKRPMQEQQQQQQLQLQQIQVTSTDKKTPVAECKSTLCNDLATNTADPQQRQASKQEDKSIPWLLIITNPSVLALTLVKYTYNICIDVIYLQLAVYLREVHSASIETISAIASGTYCMQMLLIAFVGWVAKIAVQRKLFGLSTTSWRKIFQGSSNLFMGLSYFAIPWLGDNLETAVCLLLSAAFFWMFGAGGESMVPYDLSTKYPATIVGLSHSISMFSGLTVPLLCSIIIGEGDDDPANWNRMFTLIGFAAITGGIVFVLVVEAKPFLPEEKLQRQLQKQQQQQQQQSESTMTQVNSNNGGDDDDGNGDDNNESKNNNADDTTTEKSTSRYLVQVNSETTKHCL